MRTIDKTYTKDINVLYQDALDVLEDCGIKTGTITSVSWNSRFKAVWGRCYRDNKTNTYRIELNPILTLKDVSWEAAMDTMIHEVLHCHKDRFCHTGEWKRCAEIINREYPIYNITRCTSAEEKNVADKMYNDYKWVVTCSNCGAKYKYRKAGKVVKMIRRYPNSCKCFCGSYDLHVEEVR